MNRRHFLASSVALPMAASAAADTVSGQTTRRDQINALHQKACGPLFSSEGVWTGPPTESTPRIRFWHSMSLLESEATRAKGNAVIQRCFTDRAKLAEFSHFEYCDSAQLLTKHAKHITPENRDLLLGVLRECFSKPGEIYFRGYNDNFPAMENLAATLGGEVLDDAKARQRGLNALHRILELLDRRGFLSEYTSSTYSPVTQLCYADIAEYSKDAEARRLALEIEHRIWLDLATHFHAPTNILAGPHSRAYNIDSVGHLHQMNMLFYQAFGERVWMNPVRFLYPPMEKQVIHHDGDVAFLQASNVWIASGTYHPRPEIERTAFEKQYPYRVSGTSEFGAAEMPVMQRSASGKLEKTADLFEYPAGELVSTSYQTADYAVGSATLQFHDGNQTDAFFANFRRAERPSSLRDVSTVFSRYAVNNQGPGRPWTDPRNEHGEATRDLFAESGRLHAVQKDNTAMVLYQSKAQFIDDYSVLRLVIVIPVFYRNLKSIGVGTGKSAQSKEPDIVWVEDDFFYAAFRPLLLTNHGRESAVTVSNENGYVSIAFHNYQGPPRRFTRKELLNTLNGFVAEFGSPQQHGSFDRFQEEVRKGEVEDLVAAEQRITRYRRPGVQLDISHSLYFGGVKYTLVDGQPIPRDRFSTH